MIPDEAVEAAAKQLAELNSDAGDQLTDHEWARQLLEAAAPHIRAQALADAVDAFPLETITAPDNAVVWLMRRAEQIRSQA